jgi:hypothetical protein
MSIRAAIFEWCYIAPMIIATLLGWAIFLGVLMA